MQCKRMQRNISIKRRNNCFLIVSRGNVPGDPWKPKFKEHRRNILVLELNRALGSIDVTLKKTIMFSFAISLAGGLVVEHREMVGEDKIKLSIGPVSPLFGLLSH